MLFCEEQHVKVNISRIKDSKREIALEKKTTHIPTQEMHSIIMLVWTVFIFLRLQLNTVFLDFQTFLKNSTQIYTGFVQIFKNSNTFFISHLVFFIDKKIIIIFYKTTILTFLSRTHRLVVLSWSNNLVTCTLQFSSESLNPYPHLS